MDTKQLLNKESHGTYGAFSIELIVGATALPDLSQPAIRDAAYKAAALIESAVMESVISSDPDAQRRALTERTKLLALFPQPIYVEELPNGYCCQWCCKHLPWFKVTTRVGVFTIGWRKRVISIDWFETRGTKTSDELFANENVTKHERGIHAWGPEKAYDYIQAIIASAEASQ